MPGHSATRTDLNDSGVVSIGEDGQNGSPIAFLLVGYTNIELVIGRGRDSFV